ncbi:30S ribosomal protein S4 [Patescibacteria group bacterium]|nr:30S ribosomal protein S4 [Patescibacteria group bacterium]
MARYTKAKTRISRREGMDLGLKTLKSIDNKNPLKKKTQPPGQHGFSNKRLSDYGLQLREKQKLKRIYGLLEKQFRLYYKSAQRFSGITGSVLISILEKRLDNVIYRAGVSPTRAAGRKMVGEKKVMVNGGIVRIPSYQIKVDDVVTFSKDFLVAIPEDFVSPAWLSFNKKDNSVKILASPKREDVQEAINEQLIIEFYSR